MGIKRVVDVDFWNDEKIMDMFTPEDKLFFLYLLTNPHTTQLGIYGIHPKHISFELGYTIESVKVLLERFENKYEIIKYCDETKEIAVKNFLRHSIIKGGAPVKDCLIRELKAVKNKDLIAFVFSHIKQFEINETVRSLIDEYEEKNGEVLYAIEKRKSTKKKINENENENENENDVSLYDTCHDTSNVSLGTKRKRFVPPTIEEVKAYCLDRKNNVNAEKFIDYYTSNGWYVGRNKMKDWKASVRTWEKNEKDFNSRPNTVKQQEEQNKWSFNPNEGHELDDLF